MNIGLFLGYKPETKLGNEGLGRYLGGLIKGFLAANHSVTIAAPSWMRVAIDEYFKEIDVPADAVQLLTPKHDPIVWTIYKKLVLGTRKRFPSLFAFMKKHFHKAIIDFTRTSTKNFIGYLPIYIAVGLVGLVLSIPMAIIGGVVFGVGKLVAFAKGKTNHLKKETLNADRDAMYLEVFYTLTEAVVEKLVDMVNKDSSCDIWYVPSLFWPQVNSIERPLVINAPDLVSAIYPAEFAGLIGADKATEEVKRTVSEGQYFITYCEYIRRTLLLRDYGKLPENVVAIPHVNNTSLPYIAIDQKRADELNTTRKYDLELSRKLLNHAKCTSCPPYYAERLCMDNVHYLFYASQIRPHKNMVSLVRAFEYLLRVRNIPIKLVLTGWVVPGSNLPASRYVYEHHLEHDVISFSGVPATTLSALYRCADLVVNPSMYEGGFAFTFGEGMSVGTPSLLANAPFEMDVLGPAGLENVTFDPTDWRDIAEKIEYWLPRREELYQKELPLYEELAKRTPDVVAKEYIKTFEYFIDKSRADKEMEARKTEAGKTIG